MSDESRDPGVAFITERFGDHVVETGEFRGQEWVTVTVEVVHDVVESLRDEAGYGFLEDLTAVDYLDRPDVEGRFRMVYHMLNMKERRVVRLKCYLEDEDVAVPTVSDLFATANWLERECYDMFGIVFTDHPDLRRILMAEDYEDFPLRRDFPWHGRVPLTDPMREPDFKRGVAGEHTY